MFCPQRQTSSHIPNSFKYATSGLGYGHGYGQHITNRQNGTASIERVMSFFLPGGIFDGDNDDGNTGDGCRNKSHRHGRGDSRGRRHFSNGNERDDVLQDARDKLREGLGLGDTAAAEKKLSPRRLFEYLDSDGIGEVWNEIRE